MKIGDRVHLITDETCQGTLIRKEWKSWMVEWDSGRVVRIPTTSLEVI